MAPVVLPQLALMLVEVFLGPMVSPDLTIPYSFKILLFSIYMNLKLALATTSVCFIWMNQPAN